MYYNHLYCKDLPNSVRITDKCYRDLVECVCVFWLFVCVCCVKDRHGFAKRNWLFSIHSTVIFALKAWIITNQINCVSGISLKDNICTIRISCTTIYLALLTLNFDNTRFPKNDARCLVNEWKKFLSFTRGVQRVLSGAISCLLIAPKALHQLLAHHLKPF